MMEHMRRVAENPAGSAAVAKFRTPEYLADMSRKKKDGRYAVECIIAQAYWLQINGHWYNRQEVTGHA